MDDVVLRFRDDSETGEEIKGGLALGGMVGKQAGRPCYGREFDKLTIGVSDINSRILRLQVGL